MIDGHVRETLRSLIGELGLESAECRGQMNGLISNNQRLLKENEELKRRLSELMSDNKTGPAKDTNVRLPKRA